MKSTSPQKLIFVYNADSGFRNMLLDSMHKILSPGTYDCKLCDITFGIFTENRRWKAFREKTSIPMEFLHKDEFRKAYASKFGYKFTFPIILAATADNLEIFIGTQELNAITDAERLMERIDRRMIG